MGSRTAGRRFLAALTGPLELALDTSLEATIAGSFSRIGYQVRARSQHWKDPQRLDEHVVLVTGASSGIGLAAAATLGRLGATLWIAGRDPDRTDAAARQAAETGAPRVETAVVDLADGKAVDELASRIIRTERRLDCLVHGAGALVREYTESPDGIEQTVATHVLAPFRLTWRLRTLLRSNPAGATIVTVTSGGMYTQRFDLDRLASGRDGYDGVRAYARSKRAQVVLSHEWAHRWGADGVASYAVHPGWVATPGLMAGLPGFARLGPLLRRPEEGADTLVWLAAGAARSPAHGTGEPLARDGLFLDRRRRKEHYLPWTRAADPLEDQRQLWAWCARRTGIATGEGRTR